MNDSRRLEHLKKLATTVRYFILASTTRAGSGHPTSSLSATDLMVALMFGGAFRYDLDHPENPNNDRLIFSKGHASPLFYALWLAAGRVSAEEMMTYRSFGSTLEGHPSTAFAYTDVATGSLGQGLSAGVGMALSARRLDDLPFRTYVLMGDSEMSEGSVWEAMEIAAHYRLGNLVGVIDVNRLGQRGETMLGYDLDVYRRRIESFGWEAIEIDGHDIPAALEAYERAGRDSDRPTMIIARTVKGKGVSFLENKNGWHGKVLDEEQFRRAVAELGVVDTGARGTVAGPETREVAQAPGRDVPAAGYAPGDLVATRDAYGNALKRLFPRYPLVVSLDGEVSNSTRAERFGDAFPDHFFEMYIAEQNMAGVALGLSNRGKIPLVSTFAAFWTRAFDQVRMAAYSEADIKFVGSHAGVSVGADGPSQMGLEDIAMFRTVIGSTVLHPCDAVSTERLVEAMIGHRGICYLRTLRQKTPVIYAPGDDFHVGGSRTLRESNKDVVAVVAAGATVHEALDAFERLQRQNLSIRVIDAYSIKPIDAGALNTAAATMPLLTVEDHRPEGGLGDAVRAAVAPAGGRVRSLAVHRKPHSATGKELRDFEEISAQAIEREVLAMVEESVAHTHGA